MFTFKASKEMKVRVSKEQEGNLQTLENIKICCGYESVVAFDIFLDEEIVGFAMFEKYKKRTYFLWDYAIDEKHQNKGYGTKALLALGDMMKKEYGIKKMTTTYIWGNEHAKHVYEKAGFVETSVVDEDGIHEVNMIWTL